MSKRFGEYKPQNLGPEPAAPATSAATPEPSAPPPANPPTQPADINAETMAALRAVKVPYSSRITVAADRQLKALARQGRSQTDLLAEALNLLFKKHGLTQVA